MTTLPLTPVPAPTPAGLDGAGLDELAAQRQQGLLTGRDQAIALAEALQAADLTCLSSE